MNQTVEKTYAEQVTMYMKLSRKELVEMIIECNRLVDYMQLAIESHQAKESIKRMKRRIEVIKGGKVD